uniref:Uncharacterized protein n=1 Tax=Triticum urartu TaxID=4572 RepID=A0A8R7UJW1_TRIUA
MGERLCHPIWEEPAESREDTWVYLAHYWRYCDGCTLRGTLVSMSWLILRSRLHTR